MGRRGPKPKSGEPATKQVRVWVTPTERDKLEEAARANHATVSQVVRDAINEYVSDYSDDPVFPTRHSAAEMRL